MNSYYTMKEMAANERPYERLVSFGSAALSDAELLAILLKNGQRGESVLDLSRKILSSMSENGQTAFQQLVNLSLEELMQFRGIGKVKAIELKAVGELARRYYLSGELSQFDFSDPDVIGQYFIPKMRDLTKEETHLLSLNNRLRLIFDSVLSIGSVNQTLLSVREVFLEGLRHHAVHLILLHNHPSGDPTPSAADITVTRQILAAGQLLELPLLDHLIIGSDTYYSMKEHALIP